MLALPLAADDASKSARAGWLAVALLAFAMVLGGGGSPAPRPELAVECLAAVIAALWVVNSSPDSIRHAIPRTAWLIALLVAIVPLVQLIPLPAALWQSLPGRQIERDALALIDFDSAWRPWTMAPNRTFAALLSLGPPLLLLMMTATLGARARLHLIVTIAALGLATIVVGAFQLLADNASAIRFYGLTTPQLTGFQANHNSTADILLIAMVAASAALRAIVQRQRQPVSRAVLLAGAGGLNGLFAIGVVLTASRMGIFLLPVALLASLWILRPWLPVSRKALGGGALGLLILLALGLLLVRGSPAIAAIAARFDFSEELRPQLWQDGLFVVRQHFPFGVGMGNFVPALIAVERLEIVRPFLPNRAHNDFIELAAETGLFGLLALSAISWLLGRAAWRAFRGATSAAAQTTIFAAAALLIIALHSLVDYPLRSMSLACVAAVCAGLFMSPRIGGSDTTLAGDER